MSVFRRKLISCKTCKKKVPKKKIWKVEMDTLDGEHTIEICDVCAKQLETMRKEYD